MKIRFRHLDSGIALVIVLIVAMVLGSLAGILAFGMKVETKLARNASHDVELEWLGRSGVELARYYLTLDSAGPCGQVDCLKQLWAGGPGCDTNNPAPAVPLKNFKLGNGSGSVTIIDLDRKFNINVADEIILRQALTLIGVDAAQFPTIVDSILDWRDTDSSTHPNGTEGDTYRGSSPPYLCKDGPLDDLSELLLVSGVTSAMYWGSSGEGAQIQVLNRNPFWRRSGFEEPMYLVGLVDLFTTVSGRLINVNTASATQLQIIPQIDENLANQIINGTPVSRAGPDLVDGTDDDMPFRSVGELERVGIPREIVQELVRYLTVKSLVFEVTVDAQVDTDKRQFRAILRRNSPRDIQVLNMYWK